MNDDDEQDLGAQKMPLLFSPQIEATITNNATEGDKRS
jgi:hypothetical protein